ncbi:MAG: transporter substrate-binding domain-containing protein [Bacteroidota bacterium]
MPFRFILLWASLPICSFAQIVPDTLHVAVYDSPPFGMIKPDSNGFDGLMVQLWEDIAAELDVPFEYKLADMEGVISGLQEGKYDVGLGAISITPKREELIDFTHAVNPSGTGIAISNKSRTGSFLNKWRPIFVDLLELVVTLLLMLFVSALIVFFVERKYASEETTERSIMSIADGLWWSAVTMTTVGYGDKVPRSKMGKLLGIVWIFISIIFFSLFTANASAKLVSYEAASSINTLDDLRKTKVVAVARSSGEEYLAREGISYIQRENIEEAINAVKNGAATAVVSNIPVLKYQNKTNFGGSLVISDNYLLRNNMGIALREGSPLKETINVVLLQKISEPKWQQAVYKYIGD